MRLARVISRVKLSRALDDAVRYNLFLAPQARKAIAGLASENETERAQWRYKLLDRVLRYARRAPYGRARGSSLESWPLLEKNLLRVDHKPFLVPRVLGIPCATSGSTGVPLKLERSLLSPVSEQVFLEHLLKPYGVSFRRSRVAVMRGNLPSGSGDGSAPSFELRDPKHLILSTAQLDQSNIAWYVDVLQRFEPQILWAHPSAAMSLARLLETDGVRLSIPVVLASSEVLSDAGWDTILKNLAVRIVDYYGQAERVCMAVRHSKGEWFFEAAYGDVELIPESGHETMTPGEMTARVVATGFWNLRMPLVRYDTGDLIAYPDHYTNSELRQVARGTRPFIRVIGRDSAYLFTPTGGKVLALSTIAREASGVYQVQFIQSSLDQVEIRIQAGQGFDEQAARKLLATARKRIPAAIELTLVADQPLRKAPNGKVPFVIREVDEHGTRSAGDS